MKTKFSFGLALFAVLACVSATQAAKPSAAKPSARAPGTVTLGQVRQQEQFVNVLLGRNQALINSDNRLLNREAVLISELPGRTPAQNRALETQIAKLNNAVVASESVLTRDLTQTSTALTNLAADNPANARVAAQLQAYEQRALFLFSNQIQETESILARAPASPFSFNDAITIGALRSTTP